VNHDAMNSGLDSSIHSPIDILASRDHNVHSFYEVLDASAGVPAVMIVPQSAGAAMVHTCLEMLSEET